MPAEVITQMTTVAGVRKELGKKLAAFIRETDEGKKIQLYAECKTLADIAGQDMASLATDAARIERSLGRLAGYAKNPPSKALATVEKDYEQFLVERVVNAAKGIRGGAIANLEKACVALEQLWKHQPGVDVGKHFKKAQERTAALKTRHNKAVEDARAEAHAHEVLKRADDSSILTVTKNALNTK